MVDNTSGVVVIGSSPQGVAVMIGVISSGLK
jgi:hypothetical protein